MDCLVANAGLPGTGKLESFSTDELQRALRVNLEAPMRLARALEPGMRERGDGHLVFVSSLAGQGAQPAVRGVRATKFGLRGFALCLRADLAGTGVGVSLVAPGFIRDAGMFADSGAKPPPGMGTSTPQRGGRRRRQGHRAQQGARSRSRRSASARSPTSALASPRIAVRASRAADG